MEVTIEGVTWKVDMENQTVTAYIRDVSVRISKTRYSLSPDKPFEVWLNGVPASSLLICQFYATANEAAHDLSSRPLGELEDLAEWAEEDNERAEAAAELPRFI
ncbi:MAG: hypothetical protein GF334_10250 [Candidatus Altiarchaeales archaeon]|nr:hypothetical protein [Candidatus Altiarchaeales archaeon]